MHRKRRESQRILLDQEPEYLMTGSLIAPRSFTVGFATRFAINRQSKLLDGFFF